MGIFRRRGKKQPEPVSTLSKEQFALKPTQQVVHETPGKLTYARRAPDGGVVLHSVHKPRTWIIPEGVDSVSAANFRDTNPGWRTDLNQVRREGPDGQGALFHVLHRPPVVDYSVSNSTVRGQGTSLARDAAHDIRARFGEVPHADVLTAAGKKLSSRLEEEGLRKGTEGAVLSAALDEYTIAKHVGMAEKTLASPAARTVPHVGLPAPSRTETFLQGHQEGLF